MLKTREPWQLSELMNISDDLAVLNAERYQRWQLPFPRKAARPAIYAFKGDVYAGFDALGMAEEDIGYAQQHVRILSGLYGLLRPLDGIMPYRLEMGTNLAVGNGSKDLYQFWGTQLSEYIVRDMHRAKTNILVNLASNEYFRSLQPRQLKADVITPVFHDRKGNDYKLISFWAKKARGLMARFIVQNRITQVSELKAFDGEGYYFHAEDIQRANQHSGGNRVLVFRREHPS